MFRVVLLIVFFLSMILFSGLFEYLGSTMSENKVDPKQVVCLNCVHMKLMDGAGYKGIPGKCTFDPIWVYIVSADNHYCGRFVRTQETGW